MWLEVVLQWCSRWQFIRFVLHVPFMLFTGASLIPRCLGPSLSELYTGLQENVIQLSYNKIWGHAIASWRCDHTYFRSMGVKTESKYFSSISIDMTLWSLLLSYFFVASFPCAGEEEREPGTHCSRMCQGVTYKLLRYTEITVNFCLSAERPHCTVLLPMGHIRAVLKSKTIIIALPVTVCIASFEAIGELQGDRLRHSCASWPRG